MAEKHYSYIFRCTNKTEKECFDRLLFGEKSKYESVLSHIKKGDTIFLYNIDSQLLFGTFIALTDGVQEIEKEAWGGGFPVQLKVIRTGVMKPLSKQEVEDFIHFRFAFGKLYPDPKIDFDSVSRLQNLFDSKTNGKTPTTSSKKVELSEAKVKADDGHRVRSHWERDIDNWLTEKTIFHYYEKKLNIPESMFCDFFIPQLNGKTNQEVFIELWGKKDAKYLKRKEYKISLYKKYNLNLVEIFPEDMQHIGQVLYEKLKEFGVF